MYINVEFRTTMNRRNVTLSKRKHSDQEYSPVIFTVLQPCDRFDITVNMQCMKMRLCYCYH